MVEGSRPGFDWSFCDAIYILTVYGADRRLEQTLAHAQKIGIPRELIVVIKDPPARNKAEAIWNNHRKAWYHMLESGHRRAVVVEDDMAPSDELTPESFDVVSTWLRENPEAFDIFFFGYWPFQNVKPAGAGVVTGRCLGLYAYLITAESASVLAPIRPKRGLPVDYLVATTLKNQYAAHPMVLHPQQITSLRTGRVSLVHNARAIEVMERAAVRGKLWPNLASIFTYFQILSYAGGPAWIVREILEGLAFVPIAAVDALSSLFRKKRNPNVEGE